MAKATRTRNCWPLLAATCVLAAWLARYSYAQSVDKDVVVDTSGVADDDAMVQRVEQRLAPQPAGFEDELFSAARLLQERLNNPLRALRLYQRIVDEYPNSRVALAASRRASILREITSGGAATIADARAFAALREQSDTMSAAVVLRKGQAMLTAQSADLALWLGEYAQRQGLLTQADEYFTYTRTQWPDSKQSVVALREQANLALVRQHFDAALQLALQIEVSDGADRALQAGLIVEAHRGLRLQWWLWPAFAAVIGSLLALVASGWLAVRRLTPARRGGWRAVLAPPFEVWFLLPIVALLVAASFTANVAIAPAVMLVSGYGLLATWLSGSALRVAALSAKESNFQCRAVIHSMVCVLGTLGIVYVALMRQGLLITMIETLRFGPEQ